MVEANTAYDFLKREFKDMDSRVIQRGVLAGISHGFADVDWKAGINEPLGDDEDPWAFVDDWSTEAPPEKVPLSVRSVLLGPVVLRLAFIGLFAWLWWNTFPLLPQNMGRFVSGDELSLLDVARLVAAMVYPTYALIYELISGYVSGFVREVLNGAVSWICGRYVDLRPHSASYGCALYKLLREQVYALLMLPLVICAFGVCLGQESPVLRAVFGVVGLVLAVDTLAACARGGFVNVWSVALADRVEARYLLLRARMLRRCGQWDDRRQR
jgi:hypothetical protein